MAKALMVVSRSTASIRSARQPSTPIRVRIYLNASGLPDAYHMAGMYHGYAGNFQTAALYEKQAQQLSPLERIESVIDEARARFHLGDFIAAHDIASRVLKEKPRLLTAQSTLIASLGNLGRQDQAKMIAKELIGHRGFSVSRWAHGQPYRRQEDLDALINPLRLAGLPE